MEFSVDEAGEGPVLGAMLAATIRPPPGVFPDGIDDSRRLSDETADLAERFDDEEFETALSALH